MQHPVQGSYMGYPDFTSMTKARLTQPIPGGSTATCSDSHLSVVLVVLVLLLSVLEVGVLPGALRRQEGRRAGAPAAAASASATAAGVGPDLGKRWNLSAYSHFENCILLFHDPCEVNTTNP